MRTQDRGGQSKDEKTPLQTNILTLYEVDIMVSFIDKSTHNIDYIVFFLHF